MSNIHKLIEHLVNNWQNNLSEALAPSIKKQLIDKFKLEAEDYNIDVTDKTLSDYIDYFDTRLKNNPKVTKKDLDKYDIRDLIILVSRYKGSSKEEDEEGIGDIPDVVYNENGIIIYSGHSEDNCLKFGRNEKWCITKGSFGNYRYDQNRKNPTFYLVKNTNLPDSDVKSFFVVVVGSDNTYKISDRSNNDVGGRASEWNRWEPWSFVEQNFPPVQGLQRIFKYIPISKTELAINQYKKRAIGIDEWELAPSNFKEQYLIARQGKSDLFNDISNNEFIRIFLPDNQDIATMIAKNFGIIEVDTLFKEFNSFSTQNQKSIVANTRRFKRVGKSTIASRSYPFSAKKAIVKGELLNIADDKRYYVSNDDKNIIELNFNDDDVLMSVFTEQGSTLNIKVNERTSGILRSLPKFDDIPFNILLKLTKNNFISKNIVGNIIEKSKQEDSKSSIIATNTDEGEIILDTNNFKVYKSENGEFKSIPFEDDSIQKVLQSEKVSNILQDKIIKIIFNDDDIPDFIPFSTAVLILRKTPIEKRIVGGKVIIPNITQNVINVWVTNDPLAYSYPRNVYIDRSIRNGSNLNNTNVETYSDYFNYLRSQNLAYDTQSFINLLAGDNKFKFLAANPPLTADNIYKPIQYERVWYLININDPTSSKKFSPSRGNLTNANLNAQKVATILGTTPPPQVRTPRARPAAEPTVAPAAGATAPAAGAAPGVEAITQAIETAGLTNGFNRLITPFKNRILNGTIIQTDRGASKRNEALGNRGRVTQIIAADQSRFYIIRLAGEGGFIGQASFQPEASHYIITPTRSFNMGRVGNFLASLQQNRIVTEQERLVASLALGVASNEELNELKNKIKPKKDMKLAELKKMIQGTITEILSEETKVALTKPGVEIAEPGTETAPKTKPRRTISPEEEVEEPARAIEEPAEEPARAIAKKIAARFKKGK